MKHLIALFAITFPFYLFAGEKDSLAVKYAGTINAEDLSKHLHVIASDEYEGRETGKKGQKMAAEYIVEHYKELGIPPVGDSTYYQEFPLVIKYPEGVTFTVAGDTFEFMDDFYYFRGVKDTVQKIKEVVFVGYGIDHEKYSDYPEDIDVEGKFVMVLAGEPKDKKGNSLITGEKELSLWSTNRRLKYGEAKERGAIGMLKIPTDYAKSVERLEHYIKKPDMSLDIKEKGKKPFPTFIISPDLAEKIMEEEKVNLKKVRKKISKKGKTKTIAVTTDITIDADRKKEYLTSENVLGYIEGTDKKEEVVVLTAHYDHIGKKGDEIYNGADDDGSGTVALLELAEAFKSAKEAGHGPRRSILIMPVSGEEKGLLGSQYYSENPVFPLENTVSNLNIDMIGRMDEKYDELDNKDYIYLIGSDKLSTELHAISEEANETYTNLTLDYTFNDPDDPNKFYYRSDHYNFAKHKIPIIFYFNGVHEDYHKPTDTVDKIDFEKMEVITKLVFYTAWELANREEKIKVDVENDFKE